MAVPASGEISLGSIYFEFDQNDYTAFETVIDGQGNPQIEDFDEDGVSLSDLSDGTEGIINTANASADRPDGSAPHAMSEFYSYNHDAVSPGWSSVFGAFNFSVVEGGNTDTSGVKTAVLGAGSGNVTVSITSVAANTGTLAVSVSTSGDPGTGGTANSATGFTNEGTAITLSDPGWTQAGHTFYFRFKYTSASSDHSADTRTVNLQNGFLSTTVSIGVTSTDDKSDIRLKTNIEKIGYSDMNIPIYLFNYKNNLNTTYKGVMAQDLLELCSNKISDPDRKENFKKDIFLHKKILSESSVKIDDLFDFSDDIKNEISASSSR